MNSASERDSVLRKYFGTDPSTAAEPAFWEISVADAVLRAGGALMELEKESFGVKRSDVRFEFSGTVFEIECTVADFPHWPVFAETKEDFVRNARSGTVDFGTLKAVFWTSLEKKLLKWQFSEKAGARIVAIKVFPWTAVDGDSWKLARALFSANFSDPRSDRWPESLSYRDGTARKVKSEAVETLFSKLDAVIVSFGEGTQRKNDRHAFLSDSSAVVISTPSVPVSGFLGKLSGSWADSVAIRGGLKP